MSNSINDFKSIISARGGLAHANRFAVYMTPPQQSLLNLDVQGSIVNAISGNFNARQLVNDPRDISLLCESCTIPGRQIATLDHQSVKQTIKMPNTFINEDVTFSFILTQDFYIKKIFDAWTKLVIDNEKYRVKYMNEYTTDVIIQQLNKDNLPIYGIRLKNAYPVTTNAISLDNNAENTPQKVAVTLTYEDFEEEGAVTSALGSLGSVIDVITNI